ncbi:MAG: pyridoxal 5'-phosphate synthase glutaminase subunit PdxT [Clostridiales bacterium]|nr:pyridoxal 5'-phosphate synthase glutaminase subunit PdxT [Clostridiales bacterium]
MTIAVLAVQGAFIEHEKMLKQIGVQCFEIRQRKDLEQPFDGLILPGGESTVQGKLLKELELFKPIKKKIEEGMPVFGTCAGLILLARQLSNDTHTYFGTLPVTVKRNAYGRQLGSFYIESEVKGIGKIPMNFIRAPYIEQAADEDILAKVDGNIVAVRHDNQLGISFHPEVTNCTKIHEYFCEMVKQYKKCVYSNV